MTDFMRGRSPVISLILPLGLAVAMALLDRATTWEVSLFVFYAVPIVLSVWWVGSLAGYSMAFACGLLWWLSNYDANPYETTLGYLWATISRVIFFCVTAFSVTAVRNRQEADSARIRALEERRQLEEDLVSVSEYEQQRIGQDLHDGLCQHLAAIGLAARSLANELSTRGNDCVKDAELIEQSIRGAVEEARGLARGIFPVHVDRHGLAVALSEMAKTTQRLTGLQIDVEEVGEVQIQSPEAAMHLYRIAQEAVANAARHGGASRILIRIEQTENDLILTVSDDGNGFPVEPRKGGGMGLRTMRYRAQSIGARLSLSPPDERGATLRCEMPLSQT
jgi:signal transduction histidine kinase